MSGCGGCNACCELLEIDYVPDIGLKPQGEMCKHCEVGVGCKIYADRPPPCRDFMCLWLQVESVGRAPQEARPDKSGVMVSMHDFIYVIHQTGDQEAWRQGPVWTWIERMLDEGMKFFLAPDRVVRKKDGELLVVPVKATSPDSSGAVKWDWPEGFLRG